MAKYRRVREKLDDGVLKNLLEFKWLKKIKITKDGRIIELPPGRSKYIGLYLVLGPKAIEELRRNNVESFYDLPYAKKYVGLYLKRPFKTPEVL